MGKKYVIEVRRQDGVWYIDSLRTPTAVNEYFKKDFWALGDSKLMAMKWDSRKEALDALCRHPLCSGGLVKIRRCEF